MMTPDLAPLGSQQASQHPRASKGELQMQAVETPHERKLGFRRRWPRRPGIGPSRKSRLGHYLRPQGWYGSGYDVIPPRPQASGKIASRKIVCW
jgi:hypothetical protein